MIDLKAKDKKIIKKEKGPHPNFHNMELIQKQPTEIDCSKCSKTGWLDKDKCDKCDGYGILSLNITQRMHLAYGDCYIDKANGDIVYYV